MNLFEFLNISVTITKITCKELNLELKIITAIRCTILYENSDLTKNEPVG